MKDGETKDDKAKDDETKEDETKDDDNDDDDGDGDAQSPVDHLATNEDNDCRAFVDCGDVKDADGPVLDHGRGSIKRISDDKSEPTVSLIDFLEKNADQLMQMHAECCLVKNHEWPDESLDGDRSRRPSVVACLEVVVDNEVLKQVGVSTPCPRDSHRGYVGLAVCLERFRRNVTSACLFGTATLTDFFLQTREWIGYVLRFEFLTGSTVYTGTSL